MSLRTPRLLVLGACAIVAGGCAQQARPPSRARLGVVVLPHATRLGARRRAVAPVLPPIRAASPGRARLVFSGPRRAEVALTFDDGLCRVCVSRLVRVLEATGAHATLFPNGAYFREWDPQRARIRRMLARGQLTIGNHTYFHHDAVRESPGALATDLRRNEAWIERTFGVTSRPWFRPPYGAYDAATLAVAGRLGYRRVVLWSGTVADSSPRTVPYLLGALRYWVRPGAVILLHANYPNTGLALRRMLAILAARHLRPVTVGELLAGGGA